MQTIRTQSLCGCRVLIVEDEFFLADDLEKVIKRHGGEVIGPAGGLADALQALKDNFDVAIVDINLRDEMAYSVADELTRQHKPFLLATGYSAEVIPERFRHIPRWEKPFVVETIVPDLVSLCQSARWLN